MQKNTKIFKKSFALAIFSSLVLLGSESTSYPDVPAPVPSTQAGHSPLFDAVSLRYTGVVEGTSFPYYSQAERIQTITDLIDSIQSDYSLLLYKQKTLGIDIVQIGTDAVAAEQALPDVFTADAQALGNLQFLDRVRKITANLQDSHFQLDAVDSPSPVSLGFVVSNISGKYLVTSLRPSYITNKTLGIDFSSQIAVGDEVVSIDGQDPLTAAQALKPYFPASSDLYRTNSAIFDLTSRDYSLPKQPTAAVVLNRNGSSISLNLPWGAAGVSRTDEATYLKNIGITPAYQNVSLTTGSIFDEDWRTKIGNLKEEIDFADISDPTTPVITIGSLDSPAGPVAYLRVNTFVITAVTQYQAPAPAPSGVPSGSPSVAPAPSASIARSKAKMRNSLSAAVFSGLAKLSRPTHLPDLSFVHTIMDVGPAKPAGLLPIDPTTIYAFTDFIDTVVATFKSKSMPMILDLRYNPGGAIGDSVALVSDLAPTKGTIAPTSQMFRITNLSWESVDSAVASGIVDPANIDPSAEVVAAAFTDARASGSDYSEVLPASPLTSSAAVGGYDQKIVVLTSAFCVSACDATAIMLKAAGRATIMGEPSNGTGAGFFSTFEVPDFTDTNHIIVAHLPNALFGRPLLASEDPKTISVESIEAENHPTQPDVTVEPTLADVQNGNSDLITAAIQKVTSK